MVPTADPISNPARCSGQMGMASQASSITRFATFRRQPVMLRRWAAGSACSSSAMAGQGDGRQDRLSGLWGRLQWRFRGRRGAMAHQGDEHGEQRHQQGAGDGDHSPRQGDSAQNHHLDRVKFGFHCFGRAPGLLCWLSAHDEYRKARH
jgi:hypothetical protein